MLALSALYVLAAVAGIALVDFDSTRDLLLWTALLLGGAALNAAGHLLLPSGAT